MERIELGTPDITKENVERLLELFPQVATEVENGNGKVERAVDFDALRNLLGDVAENQRERYQFSWPGKREAKAEARRPIMKTLRPCVEDSVNWNDTKNLYIEGENLEALQLLRETYSGKIKLIYIDPPYNTGNDSFVYPDSYVLSRSDFDSISGEYDEAGNRLVANTEGFGQFHSVWCSMIYQRLLLAKDLLAGDGAIFISIDDNELSNLLSICDEIFGKGCRVGIFKWNKTSKAPTLSKYIRNKYEYILCYKGRSLGQLRGPDSYNTAGPLFNSGNKHSRAIVPAGSIDCLFPDGVYKAGRYGEGEKYVELHCDLIVQNGVNSNDLDITGRFKWSQETLNSRVSAGQRFMFKKPNFTTMYYYLDSENKFIAPSDILNKDECGVLRNDEAFNDMKSLFGFPLFEYTKPVSLIKYIARMIPDDSFIALDFFSGSGTTAHAIMELNAEDGGSRSAILVQIQGECPEGSEAKKQGFTYLTDIGKERLRLAGARISQDVRAESAQFVSEGMKKSIPDIGFRVLKIDSSNLKNTASSPEETIQASLLDCIDNIKEGRSSLDLLFEILPKFRIPYSAKIEAVDVAGKECFLVEDGQLIACFDQDLDNNTIEEIAKMQPLYAVVRDSSMRDDATQANFEELFKTYSPDTVRRVI